MLKGQRILLGVSGSIAAYKVVEIVRELAKRNAEVLRHWRGRVDLQVFCYTPGVKFLSRTVTP